MDWRVPFKAMRVEDESFTMSLHERHLGQPVGPSEQSSDIVAQWGEALIKQACIKLPGVETISNAVIDAPDGIPPLLPEM